MIGALCRSKKKQSPQNTASRRLTRFANSKPVRLRDRLWRCFGCLLPLMRSVAAELIRDSADQIPKKGA
jgi:hypothetical protein